MGTYLASEEPAQRSKGGIARFLMDRILIESKHGNGVILHDQGNFILTKEEWDELKAKVDAFYAETPSELIDRHNDSLVKPNREYDQIFVRRTEKEKNRQEIDNRPTKIYIMVDHSTGYYKIGRSINPSFREKTLQSEKPTITLLFGFDSTHQQEKQLHAQYASKRIRGEWFALTEDDLSTIKEQCL